MRGGPRRDTRQFAGIAFRRPTAQHPPAFDSIAGPPSLTHCGKPSRTIEIADWMILVLRSHLKAGQLSPASVRLRHAYRRARHPSPGSRVAELLPGGDEDNAGTRVVRQRLQARAYYTQRLPARRLFSRPARNRGKPYTAGRRNGVNPALVSYFPAQN